MKDRRAEARFPPPARAGCQATLRPGCAVSLVEVSGRGAVLLAPRPLRPGSRVHLQVVRAARRIGIAGHVLRCRVWRLEAGAGVTYQAALRFDEAVDWGWPDSSRHRPPVAEPVGQAHADGDGGWAGATRRVPPLPEHDGPAERGGGKRLPAIPAFSRLASKRP
jgi:hypothetical protein